MRVFEKFESPESQKSESQDSNNFWKEQTMIKGVIQQFCKTLEQAESIQSELYEKYDSVQLVSFPTTQEEGIYIFKVEKK